MDNSETFIKMCEKAVEIQIINPCKLHVFEEGNYYANNGEVSIAQYDSHDDEGIWLPRQDQLQEMLIEPKITGDYHPIWKLAVGVAKFVDSEFQADSMEQLWLAFVMKEKYNKVWNGEDWGKIKQ